MELVVKCDVTHDFCDKTQSAVLVSDKPRTWHKVWLVPEGTFEEGKLYKITIQEVDDSNGNDM